MHLICPFLNIYILYSLYVLIREYPHGEKYVLFVISYAGNMTAWHIIMLMSAMQRTWYNTLEAWMGWKMFPHYLHFHPFLPWTQ